jgi:putative redox protein
MSVPIDVVYEGELHCTATHGPSGETLTTDAPKDNNGRGESFSPTDLMATALGTCMVTIMGIVAQRDGLDIAGTRVSVEKHMVNEPVRRIGYLPVRITVPKKKAAAIQEKDRKKLEAAALTCPVHKSLHPEVEAPVEFIWEK